MTRFRWIALAAMLAPLAPAEAQVAKWVEANQAEILADYATLLAIPNTAADTVNIRRNADHIMGVMKGLGLAPRLLEGPDAKVPPAIYGEWLVPGAKRTLVLYAHYDGSPVTPSDWQSGQPFAPSLRSGMLAAGGKVLPWPKKGEAIDPDWRIYGRSASDDKAGVMAILTAVKALKAEGKKPTFNLKIYFEGEEEAGSPNLAAMLDTHRDVLRSDGWVFFDGPAHSNGMPQVMLGVRGFAVMDIVVHGPVRPLHSGHYGNWAPNPALALSKLLASMKDADGRVTVAGFYDDVTPLSPAEQAAIDKVPAIDEAMRAELGLARPDGKGRKLVDLIHEPSLNIDGIRSADVGPTSRNVIPATATATLDLRLVKGNERDRQVGKVIRHIEAQGYKVLDRAPTMEERRQWPLIATVVQRNSGYNAERTPIDDPLAKSVIAAVEGRGATVIMPTMGGSLPLYVMRDTLKVPTITVALANHDNNQHAEDENLRLGHLWRAIDVAAAVMVMK